MQRVAEFEKVSFEQFCQALVGYEGKYSTAESETTQGGMTMRCFRRMPMQEIYDALKLPTRATSGSAGYDFKAPFDFTLKPGQTIKIPTGVRVRIDDGWWLGCFPRSGLGFKYRLQLDNTVGVIDSDYYGSGNEGHIFAKITNDSKSGKSLSVKAGDAFVQGIFIPYGITYSDDANGVRNGGMGSTDDMNKVHSS